jgi:uncharacterized protein
MEFSCPAASTQRYMELRGCIDRSRRPLRGQLQRFVISPEFLFPSSSAIQTVEPAQCASGKLFLHVQQPIALSVVDARCVVYIHCSCAIYTLRLGQSKNQQNVRKHGVSFNEARTAFFDEDARIVHDPDHSGIEDRFILLGMSRRLRLLLVCHCFRENEEQIRIISARKATITESRQYGRY